MLQFALFPVTVRVAQTEEAPLSLLEMTQVVIDWG